MKKLVVSLFLAMTMMFGVGSALATDAGPEDAEVTAPVEEVIPTDEPSLDFFESLYEKLKSSEWMMVFGGFLIALVWGVRKLGGLVSDWFKTQVGGYVTSFATAVLLSVGTAIFAGQGVSMGLIVTALGAAFVASGGWEALNDVLRKLFSEKEEEPVPAE